MATVVDQIRRELRIVDDAIVEELVRHEKRMQHLREHKAIWTQRAKEAS